VLQVIWVLKVREFEKDAKKQFVKKYICIQKKGLLISPLHHSLLLGKAACTLTDLLRFRPKKKLKHHFASYS